jgi:hypothetical protein
VNRALNFVSERIFSVISGSGVVDVGGGQLANGDAQRVVRV